jgi:hypothetical protein
MTNAKAKKARLTEDQKSILSQLLKYKALTARQIRLELPKLKSIQQVRNDLVKLKKLEMLKASIMTSHKKGAPEGCWLLCKKGASAIGVNYDSSYSRKPGETQLRSIALELELTRQVVKVSGWKLMLPLHFNTNSNPNPEMTEQAQHLTKVYQRVLLKDLKARQTLTPRPAGLNEEIKAFNAGEYESLIPKEANDWLAYLDLINAERGIYDHRLAVVLIVCPDQRSERFWSQRIEMYQGIASKISVCAVFQSAAEASSQEEKILQGGLQVVVLPTISTLLQAMALKEKALK